MDELTTPPETHQPPPLPETPADAPKPAETGETCPPGLGGWLRTAGTLLIINGVLDLFGLFSAPCGALLLAAGCMLLSARNQLSENDLLSLRWVCFLDKVKLALALLAGALLLNIAYKLLVLMGLTGLIGTLLASGLTGGN